jgi:hypothetical protein
MDMKIHPFANLFPELPKEDLEKLSKDIAENGQRLPIIRWKGQIIDGRNRLLACEMAKIDPVIKDKDDAFESDADVADFICSMNLNRRHLNASERAVIALALAEERKKANEDEDEDEEVEEETKQGDDVPQEADQPAPESETGKPFKPGKKPKTEKEKKEKKEKQKEVVKNAAKEAGVSESYVYKAGKVKDESPEKFEEIKKGEKTVSAAFQEVTAPDSEDEPAKLKKANSLVEKCQNDLTKLGYRLVSEEIKKIDG